MKKQLALALTAGVAATGAVVASAATLGGVTTKELGASTAIIQSCDTDGFTVDYTTDYDTAKADYTVKTVTLTGVAAACRGQVFSITLSSGSAGNYTTLGSAYTGTIPTGTGDATLVMTPTTTVKAHDLTHISVLITGGAGDANAA